MKGRANKSSERGDKKMSNKPKEGQRPLTDEKKLELSQTPDADLLQKFPKDYYGYSRRELRQMKRLYKSYDLPVEDVLERDKALSKSKKEEKVTKKKYRALLQENEELQDLLDASVKLAEQRQESEVVSQPPKGDSQTIATIVWSDWHIEEHVDPRTVNDLNEFNLEIADVRVNAVLDNSLKLLRANNSKTPIKGVVLALLGDFINNSIHDELAESNLLMPVDAAILAQNYLISGIQFLLDNTDYTFTIHCHSGNHGRTTKKNRRATAFGNSLETLMYHHIASHFEDESRVEFVVPRGYHSYCVLFDKYVIRFHHGHDIRYHGGVGGIYIPVNKAIARWNNGRRADLDVFAHFHQLKDGGLFICNGSVVGYNAYALSIKADHESPKQAFFIVKRWRDGRIERCGYSPIFTE